MADQKIRISELPKSTSTDGLMTIGVNSSNESVRIPLGDLLADYNAAITKSNTATSTANAAKTAAASASSAASEAKTTATNAKSTAEAVQSKLESLIAAGYVYAGVITSTKTVACSESANLMYLVAPNLDNETDTITVTINNTSGTKLAAHTYENWELHVLTLTTANGYSTTDTHLRLWGKIKNLMTDEDSLPEAVAELEKPDGTKAETVLAAIKANTEAIKSSASSATLNARLFVNASKLLNLSSSTTLAGVLAKIDALDDAGLYEISGVVITFEGASGWESWQYSGSDKVDFQNTDYWQKFGGSASVGNCYNVTNDVPKSGYYTLETAIATAYSKGYTNVGIQITFAIAENSWKTYQYIGEDSTETNFKNENNWLDLAGMSAGAETLINVDALCGACTSASYYTLEYAIAAIQSLASSTGITYAKSGLVITYKTGENTWETKQFKGVESDFGEAALWADFGGGGSSDIELSDTPAKDEQKAFSTGGAYNKVPADLSINTETTGVVKLKMVNAGGEDVGNEVQFSVGTGTGGDSTIVSFIPENSPFYAKSGGEVILKAAVRSVTTSGSTETLNTIEKVELYDRDTSQLLQTFKLNQASSSDPDTYDFSFDLSSYFSQAGTMRFKFIVYDDTDNTGSRNVNVTAVDVTIKSEQTLNYTASTAVVVGGTTKTLPMYRFANNASDNGILCTTEIYLNGKWVTIGTATIADTYSHSITINPNNVDGNGTALKHGAYRLRIHGEDISSGVVGNYLHTAIMCVDTSNETPIVVSRYYTESEDGTVKQYESVSIDFAAYHATETPVSVEVYDGDDLKQTTSAARTKTYTYTQRVVGVKTDGSVSLNIKFKATVGTKSATSDAAVYTVSGTLLDIESVSAQLMVDIDMSSRSNSDSDKSITSGDYTLTVVGSNYSTNGFVKDSYGQSTYGTDADTGIMALRIAENVTASLDYKPFNQSAMETNGLAVQFRIRTKHIADDDAKLISCISNGFGFFVTGKKVVFTTDNQATVAHTIDAALAEDSITDVAIVIEPTSQAPYSGIGVVKMYFDGELIGASYYESGSLTKHATPITFDGTYADLYLYNLRAWETYYSFEQCFNNYLLKLADTDTMITEYEFNQVMSSQAAEGKSAINRPQAASLYAIGIPYFVICKNADTEDTTENYPDYLETLNGDKKTKCIVDCYAYFPDRPWQDFKALGVTMTNQGTTSSMRPIKNIKMKFKSATMSLIHSESDYSGDELTKYQECAKNIAKNRVQVKEGGMPTNIITVKVDYSESGGANNGASTNMYNDLQRVLGSAYMTPAQNAYTGDYELNTSIDSIPCAFFRTDKNSADATSPSNGYFHAKGNWNFDKGDPKVFGFEEVAGYNDGCLNYGEFTELIAERDQSLDDFDSSIDKTAWDTATVYVLSEFCGPEHKVYRYQNDAWTETTGTMTYTSGKWRISGDVVNPVENYELRAYNALDWFQGCNSVDDLLELDSKGKPIWLTYFESRYPDDDDLNAAYEDGRKVPYQLYRWLRFCQECNHHLTADDGDITLDGNTVSGTAANRLLKWKHELHNYANVHSVICYHIFTDYIAAVDQRSKNMMVGFYLDTDGVVRMYLNHLYDGDTVLGSDNDCGLTIPALLDPNNDEQGFYQGHDSVLFVQTAAADYIWLKDYSSDSDTSDSTKTTTVATIAAAMRSVALSSGLKLFSPDGLEKYWITDRLSKWPKLVSSFDGLRKYVEHSVANDNYFYALHGLSIQRLRDFIKTRFRFRDGFYQCGSTFDSAASMRCTGTNMSITITAAKDGYFGLGVDTASSARESVYLKEGETATLHSNNTNTGSGVMLYVFGADRIGTLDLTNATPKQSGWDISECVLLQKLIIGGEEYTPASDNGDELNTLNLGQLPFLTHIDARNLSSLTSIDATYCPRLEEVYALGTGLQSFTAAETSPIAKLQLPDTMTALTLVNLPLLSYTGDADTDGLTFEGLSAITRLSLSGCPKIDTYTLLSNIVADGASITALSVPDITVTADTTILDALMSSGAVGINTDIDNACDGLSGTWTLAHLVEDDVLATLQTYFPKLTINNSQYTMIVFDDTASDPANITNLDNGSTYNDDDGYVPSGHITKIRAKLIPVKGKLNEDSGVWEGVKVSESNYQKLADGSDFDYTDSLGDGFDVMMRIPHCWYKGINDFKNQKKYIAWSSLDTEPISTSTKINRKTLSDILYQSGVAVIVTKITEGESVLTDDGILAATSGYNTYQLDVEGMKQVRWPGLNHSTIGACFLNEDGIIISAYNMAISNTLFDFVEGDYIFIDVPDGAKTFVFSSASGNSELEAIAVDSKEIEAIEPDWVEQEECLGGVYEASVDSLLQLRSISGATVKTGTGTSTTSTEWTYDSNGDPTNTPVSTLNYTQKDFQNISRRRGAGFQLIDYEMSKFVAILYYSYVGNRDAQLLCGYGKSSGGTTGYKDTLGNANSVRGTSNDGNKILGFEGFMACTYEWMDYVARNVASYESFYKNACIGGSSDSVNHKWHIYDPIKKTERVVTGITTSDGYCIARVKHGRYCDTIPSKCSTDKSKYATYYCDGTWYNQSTGRVVGRASSNAYAVGGLAYADSSGASSYSGTYFGSRLAFRGEISIAE